VMRNLEETGQLLRRAADRGAVVALLPENFALMPTAEAQRAAIAEQPGHGPIQDRLATYAREFHLWIIAGTMPLRSSDPHRPSASCLVVDADGEQRARYDKIHLFDVDIPGKPERYRESATTFRGSAPVVVETPIGAVGLTVCYDLRFPELYRELAARGATVLTVPSAFTAPTGRAHWEVLLRARAIENQCYLLAAAQTGLHDNGRETYGDSLIVEPWGGVQTRLPRGSGVICVDVDAAVTATLRSSFPVLEHRRIS